MRTHHIVLPFIVFGFFTSFLFSSCSRNDNRFRLEGHFKNLNQGEFYLYSLEQGTKDTIAVNDGSFVFERHMRDTATLVLLFPNYSELPIFARPNISLKMEGDATHLRETEVVGSEENEAMTAFRIDTKDKMPPDVQKEARSFIEKNPTSPVSTYLLRRYFLQDYSPDYALALRLCDSLHRAQPQNQHLARLHNLLEGLKNKKDSGALPAFQAISTKGDTITNKTLKSDVNVIMTWATWSYESQNAMRQLRSLSKNHPGRLSVVAICLDASPGEGKKLLERDSISWPIICDSLLWQSPVLAQLGISNLPSNILTDKRGNIVARDLPERDIKSRIESLLEKSGK